MRQLNIELLRILTMYLVLVVHAAFHTFGWPTPLEIREDIIGKIGIIFSESVSIVCVNVFVFISGWFGITPKLKSFSNFIFQILFLSIIIYTFSIITGISQLSVTGIMQCFTLTDRMWFVLVYLSLYLIAPVLNDFVKYANRRTFKLVLIALFLMQTIYGWGGFAEYYMEGYSTISFIALYLLARYLKVYTPSVTQKGISCYITCFIMCVILLSVSSVIFSMIDTLDSIMQIVMVKSFSYINPVVIVQSCSLFFIFEKMKISPNYSKVITFVASSCFAVFLLHTNPNLSGLYSHYIIKCSEICPTVLLSGLLIMLFLLLVYVLSIAVDQLRIFFWKRCWIVLEVPLTKVLDFI